MGSEEQSSSDQQQIKDTDIVFDCKYCGKSLAIDYKGAGLNIHCSDCGELVDVPIPEGMDIGDIDKSDEEMEIVVLNLRKSLLASEAKVSSLEEDVSELNSRREALEKRRSDTVYKFGAIAEQISIVQKSLEDVAVAIRKISDISKS